MNSKKFKIIIVEISVIIIAILLINVVDIGKFVPNCFFYQTTGLQCPSCGGTRCVINILHGNFKEAFLFHPILFIAICYILILNIVYLINLNRKKKIVKWIYPKSWYAIVFAVIWVIYGIVRNVILLFMVT